MHARDPAVLIVEDDAQLGQLYRTALGLAGMRARLVTDGLQALREIDIDPPDAIVLDLGLPHVSGVAVREELDARVHTRDIPIVVVTGSPLPLTGLNVRYVLRKPVALDDVVDAVQRSLARRTSEV